MLVDPKGDALIDTQALPEPKIMTLTELTAAFGAITRLLMMVHGPEALQLIAAYAEEIEAGLTPQPDDVPPPDDAWIEQIDAVREAEG